MKFYNMGNRGLKFDVCNGPKVMIPAGTKRVSIAFHQSHLVRNDASGSVYPVDFGTKLSANEQRLNVYRKFRSAQLIHA